MTERGKEPPVSSSWEMFMEQKVSLISRMGIRYVGTFSKVLKGSMLLLTDVKMMGTEGRVKGRQIPPQEKIFKKVSFQTSKVANVQIMPAPMPLFGVYGQYQQTAPFFGYPTGRGTGHHDHPNRIPTQGSQNLSSEVEVKNQFESKEQEPKIERKVLLEEEFLKMNLPHDPRIEESKRKNISEKEISTTPRKTKTEFESKEKPLEIKSINSQKVNEEIIESKEPRNIEETGKEEALGSSSSSDVSGEFYFEGEQKKHDKEVEEEESEEKDDGDDTAMSFFDILDYEDDEDNPKPLQKKSSSSNISEGEKKQSIKPSQELQKKKKKKKKEKPTKESSSSTKSGDGDGGFSMLDLGRYQNNYYRRGRGSFYQTGRRERGRRYYKYKEQFFTGYSNNVSRNYRYFNPYDEKDTGGRSNDNRKRVNNKWDSTYDSDEENSSQTNIDVKKDAK